MFIDFFFQMSLFFFFNIFKLWTEVKSSLKMANQQHCFQSTLIPGACVYIHLSTGLCEHFRVLVHSSLL